jgi:hypothetical protein
VREGVEELGDAEEAYVDVSFGRGGGNGTDKKEVEAKAASSELCGDRGAKCQSTKGEETNV